MKGHLFKTIILWSVVHVDMAPRDNPWEVLFDTKRSHSEEGIKPGNEIGLSCSTQESQDLLVPRVPGGQGATQHFTAVLHNVAMAVGILDSILPCPRAFDLQDKSQGLH